MDLLLPTTFLNWEDLSLDCATFVALIKIFLPPRIIMPIAVSQNPIHWLRPAPRPPPSGCIPVTELLVFTPLGVIAVNLLYSDYFFNISSVMT
jgi:hypothetical protein